MKIFHPMLEKLLKIKNSVSKRFRQIDFKKETPRKKERRPNDTIIEGANTNLFIIKFEQG